MPGSLIMTLDDVVAGMSLCMVITFEPIKNRNILNKTYNGHHKVN